MNLFFLKIPPIPAQLVIYVGSLASFNFRPPQNNSKGAIARKKKNLKERDQVLSERKELRERGGRILPVFPSEDFSSSSDLVCIFSYPSSPTYTHILFFLTKHL